ncbi:MAG: NYN domain-containing protein [Caldilineales bacterium]|nr:NYN domain-containing protein [Caldilineales bacterium]
MFIIDGHNLIGSGMVAGISLDQEDDELRLVRWLSGKQPQLGQPMVVVFDSGIPGGISQSLSSAGVTVIFAAQYRNRADQVIHRRVKDEMIRDEVTVVTDDAVLREAVAALGASTLRVNEFMARANKRARRKSPAPRKRRQQVEPKLPKDEVEFWLERFEGGAEPRKNT